ncbi:putative AMP-dependent synthetase/ligase, AMP-binding, AMP-binding enzyme domain, ANL [Dioscorea sansibarensis]
MANNLPEAANIDRRSGYCPTNSIFYSKRKPLALPTTPYLSVTTFVSTRNHSGTTAFIDAATGQSISFPSLWRSISSLATALSSRFSIRKGDVVLLLSPNSIYFPIACLAVLSLGAILTTTNPLNTLAEISKQITDSNPVLAFTTLTLIPKLSSFSFPIILLDSSSPKSSDARIIASIDELLQTPPDPSVPRESISQDDPATLLYSSGTTGMSKGVISTHRSLISMVAIILSRFKLNETAGPQTFICTVPMFHIYGLAGFAIGRLASGSTVVILSKFEMGAMLSAINKYNVTYLPLVPPILVAMLAASKPLPLGPLRRVFSGGAPLGKEVIEGFRKRYPMIEILQSYGLTESTAMGASTDSSEESRRYGTAGLLSRNTEAKIVDPNSGVPLPPNGVGELWLRGPYIMKGYFKNEEATRGTLDPEGWLKTGDLCYINEDGYLFIVDRLKELIKYKAYQVAPAELEALLLTHPDITDAAVIPFPDKEVGQVPMAYIVRRTGSELSEATVMEFVAKQIR